MDQAAVNLNETSKIAGVAIHDNSQNLAAVLIQTELTINKVRESAEVQQKYWDKTAKESSETIKKINDLIEATNANLNLGILPEINQDATQLHDNLRAMLAATYMMHKSLVDLDEQVRNPNIDATLKHLNETADNSAKITASAAHTADYYDKKLTKPSGFFKSLGLTLLDITWKLRQIF